MTPDQQFTLALLGLLVPIVTSLVTGTLTIVGGVILFRQGLATRAASAAAELAANHSKDEVKAIRADFKTVVEALPKPPAEVVVVNPEPVPVVVTPASEER